MTGPNSIRRLPCARIVASSEMTTFSGRIERILFSFPAYAVDDPESAAAFRSLIAALRPGTEFVVVHAAARRDQALPAIHVHSRALAARAPYQRPFLN